MRRIRTIKPEILEDEKAARLSDRAWRLWVCSWLVADDHGNLRAHPAKLDGEVFWACRSSIPIEDTMSEIVRVGLWQNYTANNEKLVHIPGWGKHQRIDNAGKNKVPPPVSRKNPRNSAKVSADENSRGDFPLDRDREGKGIGTQRGSAEASPAEPEKTAAGKAHRDRRLVTDIWQAAYLAAYGEKPSWGMKELKAADRLAKRGVGQVSERTVKLFGRPPEWLKPPFTIHTLDSNWDRLVAVKPAETLPRWDNP